MEEDADTLTQTTDQARGFGTTRRLAALVAQVNYRDLPMAAIGRGRTALQDYLCCAVAGSATPTARKLLDYLSESAGPGSCTIPGTSLTVSASGAALANGTLGHALDYDDMSWEMLGHPGVAIMPALLALGEVEHASGRDVLTAYVAGFEVASQLGMVMNRAHYERGWHATGTLGTMGAAAGAARLLRLDEDQLVAAFGIAASMASGIRANFGTDTKPFHAGRAAQHGVTAAMLAARGFTASSEIFEALSGFVNVYGDARTDLTRIVTRFGDPWSIIDPGFNTKRYPSCMSTHAAIDATIELATQHHLLPSQVDAIEVGVVDLTKNILIYDNPLTGLQGKFSMQYCVARALIERDLRIAHLTDDTVTEPGVRALLNKVTMRVDPELTNQWRVGTPRGARVQIRLRDGGTLTARVDWPTGSINNALSQDHLDQKYRDCVSAIIPAAAREASLAELHRVEEVDDISQITRLITTE